MGVGVGVEEQEARERYSLCPEAFVPRGLVVHGAGVTPCMCPG